MNNQTHPVRRYRLAAACLAVMMFLGVGAFLIQGKKQPQGPSLIASAEGYDDLFTKVSAAKNLNGERSSTFGTGVPDMAMDGGTAPQAPATTGANESTKAHSDTNNQVKGVDEADVVKTDGNYIYRLADNRISIVKVEGATMTVVSTIKLVSDELIHSEMFIQGDRLLLISFITPYRLYPMPLIDGGKEVTGATAPDSAKPIEARTVATLYDISDRTAPKKLHALSQSGGYLSARMVDGIVYIASNHYLYEEPNKDDPTTYCPTTEVDGTASVMKPGDIACFVETPQASYVVLTALSLEGGAQYLSEKAVLGGGASLYANEKHILVAGTDYKMEETQGKDDKGRNITTQIGTNHTTLLLFDIDKGQIVQKASGTVAGGLLNQFAMDEYQGHFRLVATVDRSKTTIHTDGVDQYDYEGSSSNALYVLNEQLQTVGSLTDLAKDERVYSVRFDGAMGYFVTFKQVDPLFAVDLSVPSAPKVLSALKIPGFSEYLHPYEAGLLFGFGKAADEEGRVTGLKLSMFDISSPADVKEISTAKLDGDWSVASYNHKAILVDASKKLIAFPVDNAYCLYTYEGGQFIRRAKISLGKDVWGDQMRGLFIEDHFFVAGTDNIVAYSLLTYEKAGSVKLK